MSRVVPNRVSLWLTRIDTTGRVGFHGWEGDSMSMVFKRAAEPGAYVINLLPSGPGLKPHARPRFFAGLKARASTEKRQVSIYGTSCRKSIILRWKPWALAPLALACAAIATPYFLAHGVLPIGVALERGFAIVCHQQPERSFLLFGGTVAVCSRCLGIYLGAALGSLFRTSRAFALRLLMIATALNLLDAATELAGLHGNWLGVRFALGLILGATGALLVSSSSRFSLVDSNHSLRFPRTG